MSILYISSDGGLNFKPVACVEQLEFSANDLCESLEKANEAFKNFSRSLQWTASIKLVRIEKTLSMVKRLAARSIINSSFHS